MRPADPSESDPSGRPRPAEVWTVVGLAAVALALRLFRLDAQSLWLDEVLSVVRARWISEIPEAYVFAGHGPLYFYVLAPFVALGEGEFLARLPSVLAGTALVPVAWRLGRDLIGPREGVLAAGVVTLSPFAVWYAQETRYVTLFMLFGGLSVLAAYRLVRRGTARAAGGYVVATVLTLASFVGGVFLLAGQAVWGLAAGSWRRLGALLAAQIVLGLLFLAWFMPAYGVDPDDLVETSRVSRLQAGSQRPEKPLQMGYALYAFAVGTSWGPSIRELHEDVSLRTVRPHAPAVAAAVLVVGLVGVAGIARALRRAPRGGSLLLVAVIFPVGCAFALASVSALPFNVRYAAGGFLPFAVLLGTGLAAWLERPRAGVPVTAALVLLFALSLAGYHLDPRYAREDSRAAAAVLDAHRGEGEPLVVGTSTEPLAFYYDGDFVRFTRVELVPADTPGAVEAPERIWVAATRTWQSPEFEGLVAEMERCWPVERRVRLPGYEILALRVGRAWPPASRGVTAPPASPPGFTAPPASPPGVAGLRGTAPPRAGGGCALRIEELTEDDRHRPVRAPGE